MRIDGAQRIFQTDIRPASVIRPRLGDGPADLRLAVGGVSRDRQGLSCGFEAGFFQRLRLRRTNFPYQQSRQNTHNHGDFHSQFLLSAETQRVGAFSEEA